MIRIAFIPRRPRRRRRPGPRGRPGGGHARPGKGPGQALPAEGVRKTVGVLKFLGAKDGGNLSDNLGTVNTLLARRLEVALVLANDPRNPIGIIDDASAVAARTPGANHRTPDGRKALFGAKYKLAWGDPQGARERRTRSSPGWSSVSKDLKTLTDQLPLLRPQDEQARAGAGRAGRGRRQPGGRARRAGRELHRPWGIRRRQGRDRGKAKPKDKGKKPPKEKAKNEPPADLPKGQGPASASTGRGRPRPEGGQAPGRGPERPGQADGAVRRQAGQDRGSGREGVRARAGRGAKGRVRRSPRTPRPRATESCSR